VLRNMRKGVSAIQNVYTLLMGRRHALRVYYNLLYGFPSDDPADYEQMARLLPRLFHLDSPVTCAPVKITRYSPLQAQPEIFGLDAARPDQSYYLVLSDEYLRKTGFRIEDYCYYFEREFENAPRLTRIYEGINRQVSTWRSLQERNRAWLYQESPSNASGSLVIYDTRDGNEKRHYLDPDEAEVLFASCRPIALKTLRSSPFVAARTDNVDNIVARLDDLGLIFPDGERILSLVFPAKPAPLKINQWYDSLEKPEPKNQVQRAV
jgi:hypothetical protein